MCTLSVIRRPGGVRVMFNRDEQRSRPRSLPLTEWSLSACSAIAPVDPAPDGSRGTWIGVSDAGLAACLLNVSTGQPPPPARRSRGQIVPALLSARSADDAPNILAALDLSAFVPFRAALIDTHAARVFAWNGRDLHHHLHPLAAAPLMLTSSGLGDHLVQSPRTDLFSQLVVNADDPALGQHLFHTHRWPDRDWLSVLMSRPDARSVSRTVIDVLDGSSHIRHALLDDRGEEIEPESRDLITRSPSPSGAGV